ncbi:repeat protein [Moumouvirus goulette]|uniref:Repeat protein n=1 Tax=Moumouvirus goulette TaxID=1247379 RepID=M1PH46_9VIRU|nr:repeat protein [Moumouvirus goulette]AGF85368.1 repeat protein [Moumouvirus goulette]
MSDINNLDPYYIFTADYDYIKYMLDNGYDPNHSLSNETPLMVAMRNKEYVKIINLLLEYGADPNHSSRNETSITAAIRNKECVKIINFLLEYGVDINKCDNKGWTPLMLSIFYRKKDVMEFLLEKGANPDKSENELNCLFLVHNNMLFHDWNLNDIELLLNHGMNPNCNISTIYNSLISDNEAYEFIKLLLDHGLNTRMKYKNKSILDLMKENKYFESTKLLEAQELLNEIFERLSKKIPRQSNKINYKPTSIRAQILLFKLDMGIDNDFDHLKSKYYDLFNYFGIYDADSMYTKLNNSCKYI